MKRPELIASLLMRGFTHEHEVDRFKMKWVWDVKTMLKTNDPVRITVERPHGNLVFWSVAVDGCQSNVPSAEGVIKFVDRAINGERP
jgi:hypothetical protein